MTINRLAADFKTEFDRDNMRANELFTELLVSPEFEAWWATRPK